MRFSFSTALVLALAAEGTIASTWFGKAGMYSRLLIAAGSMIDDTDDSCNSI